jgi:arylsulfatase A
LLKMGAVATAGMAGIGTTSCSNEKDDQNFDFDSDIYLDPERDKKPVAQIVSKKAGFMGKKPNIVLILADDLGYGDLGCYGSKALKTPHVDNLAEEGVRFTDFYAANSICSPSRAALLTGRYAHRTGVTWPVQAGNDTFMRSLMIRLGLIMGDLGAIDMRGAKSIADGLPLSEVTMADALKVAGYRSACIGKWHIGDYATDERFQPRKHGFDHFLGINGANDDFPVAYWRNETVLKDDVGIEQGPLTGEFTHEAVEFIEQSKDQPFFLYFSHKDPHLPNIPSKKFKDSSEGGRYGDTVEEMDWSVGEIMKCLKRNGLDDNTLVIFTSDNGPWYEGSAGEHRGRKGQSFEGGYRVPMIARWPGNIPAGQTCEEPAMGIDFFPTFLELAGLDLPNDRITDGKSIRGLLDGSQKKSPHEALYFFHHNELEGIRSDKWKYFRYINTYTYPIPVDKPNSFIGSIAGGRDYKPEGSDESVSTMASWPVLYNMKLDSSESYNVNKKYPEVADRLRRTMIQFEKSFIQNPRGWL